MTDWPRRPGAPASDGDPDSPHYIFPADHDGGSPEYRRLHSYLWSACEYPTRPLDEACMFPGTVIGDGAQLATEETPGCICWLEWKRRGCPVTPLTPVPEDAPRFR